MANNNAETSNTNVSLNRFQRFLTTGNDRLSACIYNVDLKIESIKSLFDLIKDNHGVEAVNLIKKYKEDRLLFKNDTLVYSLAVCVRSKDERTKKAAYEIMNTICQNPLDFFKFVSICETISFEIAFKLGSNRNAIKNSIDMSRVKNLLKPSKTEMKFDVLKSHDKSFNINAYNGIQITKSRPLSRHSSGAMKPLLSLRLNSGKSSQNNSDLVIETMTADIFSSRKTSAASTLRSELTFLTTDRKESALTSTTNKTTHLPLLPTSRLGSSKSGKKIELPLISERTNSGKSRNQTPVIQSPANRPGSAKPVIFFDLNGDLTPSRRFSESMTNSMSDMPLSPGAINASYPTTKSSSLASIEQQKSVRPLSRASSVKSVSAVPAKSVSRQNSVRVGTPNPNSNPPSFQPPLVRPITDKNKVLSFATASVEILADLEATSTLTVSNVQPNVADLTTQPSSSTLVEMPKKHVDVTAEPIFIKSAIANGSNGWGRAHRRAISSWYLSKDPKSLVFLITKYQRHNKWTHNDILKLAHPKSADPSVNMIFKYITKGFNKVKEYYASLKPNPEPVLNEPIPAVTTNSVVSMKVENFNHEVFDYVFEFLDAFNNLKKSATEAEVIKYIGKYNLHFEHIPTKYLKHESVWLALIENSLPIDVILRNLNKLSSMPTFTKEDAKYVDMVCEKLKNKEELLNLSLTPFTLLNIWTAYEKGHSKFSKIKKWTVNTKLNLTLQNAFHESLNTNINSKKKVCVLLNVWKFSRGRIYGNANINSLEAALFMCLSHVYNEENCKIFSFTDKFNQIEMTKNDSFRTVYDKIWSSETIGTKEYIKAIELATNEELDFDVFLIYTNLLLSRNLDVNSIITNYRKKLNKPNTKLIVVSLVASLEPVCSFNDPLSIDLLGFRYETPNIIYNFISDKF